MKRFIVALSLLVFVVGFVAFVAPQPTMAAKGGINCGDAQPGKGKNGCAFDPAPCDECVCVGHCKWECTPIPGCVP